MTKHTFTNSRSNETVTTEMEAQEVLRVFHRTAGDQNWMWFWLVKHAERMKAQGHPACQAASCEAGCTHTGNGSSHGHQEATQAPRAPVQAPAQQDMMAFIGDSFLLALGLGLKRPMIRVHYKGKRYKIYLSARGTICIKAGAIHPGTQKPVGNEEYIGCVYKGEFRPASFSLYRGYSDTRYDPSAAKRPLQPEEKEFLDRMSADPVGFLAEASKDMCRCCYCWKALSDKRSKDVGYGPDCAQHWGLPWGKSYDEKVPSFAQLWQKSSTEDTQGIKSVCAEIKALRAQRLAQTDPSKRDAIKDDEQAMWFILGDLLQDLGMVKLPEMPGDKVKMPAL